MIALAMVLDAVFGEPKWLWSRMPHPAVLMGRAVASLDRTFNADQIAGGVVALVVLVCGAAALGVCLSLIPGIWVDVLLGAILLAHRSLIQHVQAVANALRLSVSDGRDAVAMIVGRDVRDMDGPAVARSAIESAAENFSDGVIAPLFWFVVAGLPGILVYKVVNTADSMIGYRTPKYEKFGKAAARLDDVLNWAPARLTAALFWLVTRTEKGGRAAWTDIRRDAALHRSPNAGWPEAAMAPALGVALSGPRSYDGTVQDLPWVHEDGRKNATPGDIDRAITILWKAWAVAFGIVVVIAIL